MTGRTGTVSRWPATAWVLAALLALSGCGGAESEPPVNVTTPAAPHEAEEERTDEASVPEAVREHARVLFERLGVDARCDHWSVDHEDGGYECAVVGFPGPIELDIEDDGAFSEWEIVLDPEVVRGFAPAVFDMIEATCGDAAGATFEISLRREELVVPEPDPAALWGEDGVYLEVQCEDGEDFEVDAYGSMQTDPDDDLD